ncbi:MAG: dTDP-4-dehydrorhamnose reductase [Bacteroidales bacterium]|nr:dTDP-4-dehydrorhamnose reductase [Bacteroidales bacterium]
MNHILITGCRGQLGKCLKDLFEKNEAAFTYARVFYTDIEDLNIVSGTEVKRFLQAHEIGCIINTAAYTAVDMAETDKEAAFAVNADAVSILSKAAKESEALLVHISTDYVFDGLSRIPYRTTDPTHPLSIYGQSKMAGEIAMRASSCRGAIFRTSWLYSQYGKNFVKTILQKAGKEQVSRVVDDQTGAPTWATDLARAIFAYLACSNLHDRFRVFHYANEGQTTWYGFAKAITRIANLSHEIIPVPTTAYPTPAPRPAFSLFDLSETKNALKIHIPKWENSLTACLNEMKQDINKTR